MGKRTQRAPDFAVDLIIFPVSVYVWLSKKRLDRYVDKQAGGIIDPSARFDDAFNLRLEERDDVVTQHLYFHGKPRRDVVYHETLHATFDVLNHVGITPSNETEELVCYVQGYLAEQVIKNLKARKKFAET